MNKTGLFIIPIKIDNKVSTYNDYIDFLSEAENSGYSHFYIGEHLTDKREDIQSSIVFAAALLSRTKKAIICLSVLPLPHYEIKLLIKQLEDLYRLGKGRIKIGFSPGALKTDADYMNIDHNKRGELFKEKLIEFESLIENSEFLNKLSKKSFFSTLLSTFPVSSSLLIDKGYSAVSSNFTHSSYLINHIKCMIKNKPINEISSNWHITLNLVNKNTISDESKYIIKESLFYIYQKLNNCKMNIMLPENKSLSIDENDIKETLFNECIYTELPYEVKTKINNYKKIIGYPIVNLFDCILDNNYINYILSIPSNEKILYD